jgi:hypothetical protein
MHRCMKNLNPALYEAVRCHARYMDSLEKVLHLLALHSDTVKDARIRLGQRSTEMVPTHPATAHISNAHSAWNPSAELDAVRAELDELKQLTYSGRQIAKHNKTNVKNTERYAIRCAALPSMR